MWVGCTLTGRVESIMVSAPPLIAWRYNVTPGPDSPEADLVKVPHPFNSLVSILVHLCVQVAPAIMTSFDLKQPPDDADAICYTHSGAADATGMGVMLRPCAPFENDGVFWCAIR